MRALHTLLKGAARRNYVVRKYKEDLEFFAELRNILVHEQKKPGFIIAEPHQDIVEIVVHIADTLEKPPLVIPKYQRSVVTFTDTDFISKH